MRHAAAAKSLQLCPTLCDPIHGSPPGSPVPGILQARTLEWVAISFSNAWKWRVKVKVLSCIWPSATPWTAAHQAPLSMGFSRPEYWNGVPLPSPKWGINELNCSFMPHGCCRHRCIQMIICHENLIDPHISDCHSSPRSPLFIRASSCFVFHEEIQF